MCLPTLNCATYLQLLLLPGNGGWKKTWESAFKSGKLSTVAVLCLQAGRQTTFHLQELLSTLGRLGRLPLAPLAAQHFEHNCCFEAPLRLSTRRGWRPCGSDLDCWVWVSCWHCWLSQVIMRLFCFIHILLWERSHSLVSSWTSSKCVWLHQRCKLVARVWRSVEKLESQFCSYCQIQK